MQECSIILVRVKYFYSICIFCYAFGGTFYCRSFLPTPHWKNTNRWREDCWQDQICPSKNITWHRTKSAADKNEVQDGSPWVLLSNGERRIYSVASRRLLPKKLRTFYLSLQKKTNKKQTKKELVYSSNFYSFFLFLILFTFIFPLLLSTKKKKKKKKTNKKNKQKNKQKNKHKKKNWYIRQTFFLFLLLFTFTFPDLLSTNYSAKWEKNIFN